MALMGLHYFHGAPQLARSQGCRLMELDEWTVTWTEQVDPPLPPPRPLLTQTRTCLWTHRHTLTNADIHTGRCAYTSSSKERVYSCKVKHGKEETNYPPDRWLGMWEAWSFFLPEVWNPAVVGCWQLVSSWLFMVESTLKEHLPHCLNAGVKMRLWETDIGWGHNPIKKQHIKTNWLVLMSVLWFWWVLFVHSHDNYTSVYPQGQHSFT